MVDRSLQFNLTFDLKKGNDTVDIRAVDKFAYEMENYIVDSVSFVVANNQQKLLVQNINSELAAIVDKELRQMGRKIDQFVVGINDRAPTSLVANKSYGGRTASRIMTGPPGSLGITGNVSRAFSGVNMGPYSLVSGTGPWPARSPTYLARKKKDLGHTKWFESSGQLKKELRDPSTYYKAYGPVRVSFKKQSISQPKPGQSATRMSSGVVGRADRRIILGEVRVSVLGRITEDMLANPGERQPSPWKTGLFGSLNSDLEAKLLNREDAYRPFLEVFLSFYLTRAIPNAVFRRLEDKMRVGQNRAPSAKRYSSRNMVSAQQALKPR